MTPERLSEIREMCRNDPEASARAAMMLADALEAAEARLAAVEAERDRLQCRDPNWCGGKCNCTTDGVLLHRAVHAEDRIAALKTLCAQAETIVRVQHDDVKSDDRVWIETREIRTILSEPTAPAEPEREYAVHSCICGHHAVAHLDDRKCIALDGCDCERYRQRDIRSAARGEGDRG